MQHQLLLLWTLTAAFVSCQEAPHKIKVIKTANGIKLDCENYIVLKNGKSFNNSNVIELVYGEDATGKYECVEPNHLDQKMTAIYVKFRTCENCIEIDMASLTGLIIGNVMATVVVGVAVYFFTIEARTDEATSNKKRDNKQRTVANERTSRGNNENYEPLRPRNAQKRDEYDKLNVNKR